MAENPKYGKRNKLPCLRSPRDSTWDELHTEFHTTHIIVKLSKIKDKEKFLKAAREKQFVTFEGSPEADFLAETTQDRREWDDIFQVLK